MWRLSFLILAMMAGPAVADLAGDVQRKLDAAAAVLPDSREAALERVLLLAGPRRPCHTRGDGRARGTAGRGGGGFCPVLRGAGAAGVFAG